MGTLVLLIVTLSSIIYVLSPLFRNTHLLHGIINESNSNPVGLKEDYSNILSSIKELEFDYDIGNISHDDFDTLNKRYRREALILIKKLEPSDTKVRNEKKTNDMTFCTNCGSQINAKNRFCGNCGERIIH